MELTGQISLHQHTSLELVKHNVQLTNLQEISIIYVFLIVELTIGEKLLQENV